MTRLPRWPTTLSLTVRPKPLINSHYPHSRDCKPNAALTATFLQNQNVKSHRFATTQDSMIIRHAVYYFNHFSIQETKTILVKFGSRSISDGWCFSLNQREMWFREGGESSRSSPNCFPSTRTWSLTPCVFVSKYSSEQNFVRRVLVQTVQKCSGGHAALIWSWAIVTGVIQFERVCDSD